MERAAWHKRPLFFNLASLPNVRGQLIRLAVAQCPPLQVQDAVGLMVLGLSMRIIRFVSPKNVPLLRVTRGRCACAALEIIASAHPELLYRAGVISVVAPVPHLARSLVLWWKRWNDEVLAPVASGSCVMDDRCRQLLRIAGAIMSEAIAENVLDDVRKGLRASRREHGKRKYDLDEDDPRSVAAAFWAIPPSDDKEDHCYYIGRDNKIHVSWTYIRDKQGRSHRRMLPIPAEASEGTNFLGRQVFVREIVASDICSDDAIDVLESLDWIRDIGSVDEVTDAVASVEIVEALQSVLGEIRAATKLGVVGQVLLDHAHELVDGRTTPTDLARQRGMSERTFRDTWCRMLNRMAVHPKLRGLRESA